MTETAGICHNSKHFAQGSEEWFLARCGKVTASKMFAIMDIRKDGKPGASRAKYMHELISERLTNRPTEHYRTRDMLRGSALEEGARQVYADINLADVKQVGFTDHPIIENFGASPDGFVEKNGLVEIKAPKPSVMIGYLLSQAIPKNYIYQMQAQMSCAGSEWCDFFAHCPDLPSHLSIWQVRVKRDPDLIEKIERATIAFLDEVQKGVDALAPTSRSRSVSNA